MTFLKDGLGVITPMVGNAGLKVMLGLELAGIGLGMLVPLSVGLSGLLGAWCINTFGETVAGLGALGGTAPEHLARCGELVRTFGGLGDADKAGATAFLTAHCGDAAKFVASPKHFQWVVMWFMWPATAMMITAALTSVIVPLIRNALERRGKAATPSVALDHENELIPRSWILVGITVSVIALVWLQDAWFSMPWKQVLLAVAIQPILIVAGVRVLGLTGQGPVSLMANATQFLFGLIWPAHIRNNLQAAHIAADPQASGEQTIGSFWIARRLGGRFRTLIVAQLIMIPIGALLLPPVFNLLRHTYGIGLGEGQLSAPTGLKIASLAIVMEKGLSALPPGALTASIVAAILGVVLELLIAVRRRNADGTTTQRFGWVLVPSAFGFALILPPILMIALAMGSVISAAWRHFSTAKEGSYELYAAPFASGLVAGEAVVGAVLIPLLGTLLELLKPYLR